MRVRVFIFIFLSTILYQKAKSIVITGDSAITKNSIIGAKFHYGFVWAHRKTMQHLLLHHTPGFEITFLKQTIGKKEWQRIYANPEIGICYFYTDLANNEQLGVGHGLYPYINFPLLKSNISEFNFRFGCGVGYISKIFDRYNNYKNLVIGSHINAVIGMHFEGKINMGNHLCIRPGFGLTHFSNGAFKTPNLGANILTASLGISYSVMKSRNYLRNENIPDADKKVKYSLYLAGGVKEIYPIGNPKFTAFTATLDAHKAINIKERLGLCLDIFYDSSSPFLFRKKDSTLNNDAAFIKYGFAFSHELIIGKLSIFGQMGVYLYSKDKSYGNFYHRLALRYFLSKHLIANLALKTHFAKADYIETGVGYRF